MIPIFDDEPDILKMMSINQMSVIRAWWHSALWMQFVSRMQVSTTDVDYEFGFLFNF